MHKVLGVIFLAILLTACSNNTVVSSYKTIKNGWDKDEPVSFTLEAPDTTNAYNVFINVRNNDEYQYSNLYIIVNMSFPEGETLTDTLQYEMTNAQGAWLGKGISAVKESKLWYKENVKFPKKGIYTVSVEQAMRKNGKKEGIASLKGITDVGIDIEKTKNN